MLPTLLDGDLVLYKKYSPIKSELTIGQIIIFEHPLKSIKLIKRIKSIGRNYVEVLGDNIKLSEDSTNFGLINKNMISGILTSKININIIPNFTSLKTF